jgi:hypothetical protein
LKGLWPKEHGAYAQLGFPLLTGLLYAGGDPGAVAFALVAVAGFLAHEPMALIMGMRGIRLRDALIRPARRRLWWLAGLAGVALVAAVAVAPARAWRGALVPAVLGLIMIPLFFTDRVKTMGGEVIAAAAFSAALLPVALAGPVSWAAAWIAAAVWLGAVLPAIVVVHAVKASHKGRPRARWLVPAGRVLAVAVASAGVAAALWLPHPGVRGLAVLPPAMTSLVVGLVLPHPRHLKRIGWAVVTANVVALAFLLFL